MVLKLKAKVYQYTGIYLAKKEENEYLKTVQREVITENRLLRNSKHLRQNDMTGLNVAVWQIRHGFHTYTSTSNFKVIARLEIIFKQLKSDLGF